jgi:hypothetical protein
MLSGSLLSCTSAPTQVLDLSQDGFSLEDIYGCWESSNGKAGVERAGLQVCFERDGTLLSTSFARFEGTGNSGTYRLSGDKLTIVKPTRAAEGFPSDLEGRGEYRCRISSLKETLLSLRDCTYEGDYGLQCKEQVGGSCKS